jgi:hypothetical protein
MLMTSAMRGQGALSAGHRCVDATPPVTIANQTPFLAI